MFKILEKRNLSHRIIDEIKEHIIKQKLKPGDRLATETEIAEAMSVSRASVRGAVRVMEAIGILESSPKRGIHVKEFDPERFFRYLLFDPYVDAESIMSMLEFRLTFDLGIAELVVERATEEDLKKMGERVEGMRGSLNRPVDFYTNDWGFHFAIYNATGNDLIQTHGRLMIEFFVATQRRWWDADQSIRPDHFQNHERIFLALKARNVEGMRQAVRDHFDTSMQQLFKRGQDVPVKVKEDKTGSGSNITPKTG